MSDLLAGALVGVMAVLILALTLEIPLLKKFMRSVRSLILQTLGLLGLVAGIAWTFVEFSDRCTDVPDAPTRGAGSAFGDQMCAYAGGLLSYVDSFIQSDGPNAPALPKRTERASPDAQIAEPRTAAETAPQSEEPGTGTVRGPAPESSVSQGGAEPPISAAPGPIAAPSRPNSTAAPDPSAASASTTPDAAPIERIVLSAGVAFRDCAKCPPMAPIGPGRTSVGAAPGQKNASEDGREAPAHDVRFGYSFAISTQEITVEEWGYCVADKACSPLPGAIDASSGALPAAGVSFEDAKQFITWLIRQTGHEYRLPTESEWEYAAAAGSKTLYWWGDDITPEMASYSREDAADGARASLRPAASGPASPWGLYNVHGNLWEWVDDCWLLKAGVVRPRDGGAVGTQHAAQGADCDFRVLKGGSWLNLADALRVSARIRIQKERRGEPYVGFRVVRFLVSNSKRREVIENW